MITLLKNLSSLYYQLFPKLFGFGYNQYKINIIKKKLNNYSFTQKEYIDERIVEIPWVIKKLNLYHRKKILDAGCTLNYSYLIDEILKNDNKLTYVNLYPEKFADKRSMVSYLHSDITKLNIADEAFDVVTCISVLEHIGFNNEIYDTSGIKNKELIINENLYLDGIREIRRVLKKDGTLYLSIPYGKQILYNNLQQFGFDKLNKIINIFKPSLKVLYYKYFDDKKNGVKFLVKFVRILYLYIMKRILLSQQILLR